MQNHGADPFGIAGQVLDAQYRVDRLVGEGGFSAVYRGHHLGLDEPIAIKCLKLPPSLSPPLVEQFSKRFRDESRILYRLSQGNLDIVRSIAAGTWQANTGAVVPYMILEWMEGRSLASDFTIRRTVGQKGRTLGEVVELFASAAEGLAHAHAQGVVHRDLNPGNLFLAATPQGTRMKVLDFGVAKILDDSTLDIVRTQTVGHIRIFAPAYGAPEQFDDAIGKVGAASDVYSFALILLEALRDRSVNEGTHLGEFAQKAIDPSRRPTPRMLGLDVSDEIEQIFARATAFDPRERWQSAGELWQALSTAVGAASRQGALPPGARNTQKGMAPPPHSQDPPPPGARLDKTLPIGSAMPKLNVPRAGGAAPPAEPPASSRGPSAPKVPAAPGVPRPPSPSAPRVAARPSAPEPAARPSGADRSEAPRLPGDAPPAAQTTNVPDVEASDPETEDEVTRVRAPGAEVLQGLAEIDAHARAAAAKTQLSQGSTPRPAAGAAASGAPEAPQAMDAPRPMDAPQSMEAPQPMVASQQPPEPEPASGGTFMMAPGYGHPGGAPSHPTPGPAQDPRQTSGHHPLMQTLPLAGPHPLGMHAQHYPQHYGHAPAAGAPPGHGQMPQQPSYPYGAMQHPQHPHHAMLQPPPHPSMQAQGPSFAQPQLGARMGESMSMPPASVAGVPKKNNTILFVAIGMGSLALIGIVLAIVVVVGGKSGAEDDGASGAAASDSVPVASAPPPPTPPEEVPPPVVAPVASAEETADASDDAGSEEAAEAAATATATAATPPEVARAPVPVPVPVVAKDAGPPRDPNAFDEAAARSRLGQANGILVFCKKAGGVTGPGSAMVTFATDGSVSAVTMAPPYAGTPAGDCVTGHFKRTKVSPFQGSPQTIKHAFEVPK